MPGTDRALAEAAARRGIMNAQQLQDAIAEHERSGMPMGEILLQKDYLTRDQLEQIHQEAKSPPVNAGSGGAGALSTPRQIGKYVILRELRRGGPRLSVFLADDQELGTRVLRKKRF